MSYSRPPNVIVAGVGLVQSPAPSTLIPPGVVTVKLDSAIATSTSLGTIQVGSGLSITPAGVLSATNSGSLVNVKLTSVNYTALGTDYYVGAITSGITITLPLGVVGKVYYIKNQSNGNITLKGSGGQTINSSSSRTLGDEAGVIVVFDGTRWNTI